jgi:hypothetical protein
MQGLRQVRLSHVPHTPVFDLQCLPSSITQLSYCDLRSTSEAVAEPSLPPQLPQLTALLHLDLQSCRLPPTLLGSMTQLQTLHLSSCTPLRSGGTGGAEALLAGLANLLHLQDLHLCCPSWDLRGVAPQRFSALTASSHLTRLAVEAGPAPLVEGAAQHMFPAPGQQGLLRELVINAVASTENASGCIDSADLVSIVSNCSALQHLDICNTVQPGADLSALLQLPGSCTALLVGGAALGDAAAATVAQLAQLRHLEWFYSRQLTDAGLEQLTALDLERLSVDTCAGAPTWTRPDDRVFLFQSLDKVRQWCWQAHD